MVNLYKKCEETWIEWFWTWMHPYFNILNNSVLNWEYTAFCAAMRWKWIAISKNWTITLCSYTTSKIWNIDDLNFWENSNFANLIIKRMPWNEVICKWCELEWHCAWMCQATREVLNWQGEIQNFCEFFKKSTELLLKNDL
jgi:radical SAM protein with 4Fe4S-binding SPASM domain